MMTEIPAGGRPAKSFFVRRGIRHKNRKPKIQKTGNRDGEMKFIPSKSFAREG
jgi:hypothetical protein